MNRKTDCSCGSGKKYSECCGNNKVISLSDRMLEREMENLRMQVYYYLKDFSHWWEKAFEQSPLSDYMDLEELWSNEEVQLFFWEWLIFDYRLPEGDTVFELFLKKENRNLPPHLEKDLINWKNSNLSLCRVIENIPERGEKLMDVFSGNEKMLFLPGICSGTEGELRLCRLLPFADRDMFFLGLKSFPKNLLHPLLDMLEDLREDREGYLMEYKEWEKFLGDEKGFFLEFLGIIHFTRDSLEKFDSEQETADLFPSIALRGFLSEPQPMLDGKSPRELSFDPKNRRMLEKFIQDFFSDEQNKWEEAKYNEMRMILGIYPKQNLSTAEKMNWDYPAWKKEAEMMEEKMPSSLFPMDLDLGIKLWHIYCNRERPIIKKNGCWAAAIEYLIGGIFGMGLTQQQLGEKYAVSVGTVSKNFTRIYNFIEHGSQEVPREIEENLLFPRHQ